MTTHAPAVPRRQPRLQAEHVVAAIAATLAIIGFSAAVGSDLPQGRLVKTTCAWRGSQLVVTGGLLNPSPGDGQFRITTRISIAGRTHPLLRRATKDLSAFSAHRWTALPYGYARKGLVGNAIVSCVARVHTIPPPSGED